MTPTEKIDAALDSVLRVGNLYLKYESPRTIKGMREAMRKIMSDSYAEGENAAYKAIKIKQEPWQMPESMKRAQDAMKGK